MDDIEFRRNAVINPNTKHADFLHKTKQNRSNHEFVQQQMVFDQNLHKTLNIPVADNLADRIILKQQLSLHQSHRNNRFRSRLAAAIAASVILIISIIVLQPETLDSSLLNQQVINHVNSDTHALNVRMDVPKTAIDTMLASYGGRFNGPIGEVTYLGHCIIGDKTGLHLVLKTRQGLVTVMILPNQTIDSEHSLKTADYQSIVYPAKKGSIAIIAEHSESIRAAQLTINQNLNWIL